MRQSVILIHTLPNGQSHFDWLIDQPELQKEHRLLSFRCHFRPDEQSQQMQEVEQMPDHRFVYLSYEGPVSNNRGSVARVAFGSVVEFAKTDRSISVLIQWGQKSIRYHLTRMSQMNSIWQLDQSVQDTPLDE